MNTGNIDKLRNGAAGDFKLMYTGHDLFGSYLGIFIVLTSQQYFFPPTDFHFLFALASKKGHDI